MTGDHWDTLLKGVLVWIGSDRCYSNPRQLGVSSCPGGVADQSKMDNSPFDRSRSPKISGYRFARARSVGSNPVEGHNDDPEVGDMEDPYSQTNYLSQEQDSEG